MIDFSNLAPFLKDPLILVGFFIFLAFGFVRYLVQRGVIQQLSGPLSFRILKLILIYGFVIGLALIAVGFLLKYQEVMGSSRKERAYEAFLQSMSGNEEAFISELLVVGGLAEKVGSDGEIQALENHFAELLSRYTMQDVYVRMVDHTRMVRLYGSDRVQWYIADLLDVLAMNPYSFKLERYPTDVRDYVLKWRDIGKTGEAVGYKARIENHERVSLVLAAKLYENLIRTMNQEVR